MIAHFVLIPFYFYDHLAQLYTFRAPLIYYYRMRKGAAPAMELITIGVEQFAKPVLERLTQEVRTLQKEGLPLFFRQSERGSFTFISFCLTDELAGEPEKAEIVATTRQYVGNLLAELILTHWEQVLVQKLISINFYYFDVEEQKTIQEKAMALLDKQGADQEPHSGRVVRKCTLLQEIFSYFESHQELVIDGFVRFRLKNYMQELEDVVERAVDDFLMEREYKEFIRLLRYFVDVQEPKVDFVHVLPLANGSFQLLDKNHKALRGEYLESFVLELAEGEVNYDDLLISALITIAPQKMCFHLRNNTCGGEVVETVKNVFSGRVEFCHGCSLCLGEGMMAVLDAKPHD